MNSKGFTLVELLASIVILALILAIAIPGVSKVSEAIRENQRENIIERIEIAASKYAFDTGETIIFVDTLVTEGYIESDDEKGNIDDPLNNTRMNCYVVEMEKTNEYYKAKFIDDKNYDNSGVCDLSKLQEYSAGINILVSNSNGMINDLNGWLNGISSGGITLKAISDSININCEVYDCTWSSNSGVNNSGSDSITLNNINGILDNKYTFQITIYDENNAEVKRYKASVNLKIDNEGPTIYENETTVTNKFVYSSTKDVKIVASDGRGSGIMGYYLGIDDGKICNSTSLSYQTSNTFTINENGTYQICVKDKVGNISASSLKISYIQ